MARRWNHRTMGTWCAWGYGGMAKRSLCLEFLDHAKKKLVEADVRANRPSASSSLRGTHFSQSSAPTPTVPLSPGCCPPVRVCCADRCNRCTAPQAVEGSQAPPTTVTEYHPLGANCQAHPFASKLPIAPACSRILRILFLPLHPQLPHSGPEESSASFRVFYFLFSF